MSPHLKNIQLSTKTRYAFLLHRLVSSVVFFSNLDYIDLGFGRHRRSANQYAFFHKLSLLASLGRRGFCRPGSEPSA
jgi:hypothetical protein